RLQIGPVVQNLALFRASGLGPLFRLLDACPSVGAILTARRRSDSGAAVAEEWLVLLGGGEDGGGRDGTGHEGGVGRGRLGLDGAGELAGAFDRPGGLAGFGREAVGRRTWRFNSAILAELGVALGFLLLVELEPVVVIPLGRSEVATGELVVPHPGFFL